MKKLIIILILALLCIGTVDAITVSGTIRYNKTLQAGYNDSFTTKISMSSIETKVIIDRVLVNGGTTCNKFITIDTSGFTMPPSVYKITRINIPTDAYNGVYKCSINYVTPTQGSVQFGIGTPIVITVINGIDVPTPVPTLIPTPVPTLIPTPVPTLIPTSVPTEVPTPVIPMYMFGIGVIIVGLLFGFILIIRKFINGEEEEEVIILRR